MRRGMLSEAVYRSDFLQETAPMPQGSRVIPGVLPEGFFFFLLPNACGQRWRNGRTGVREKGLHMSATTICPPQLPVSRAGAAALHREQYSDRVRCPHTIKHTTKDKVWVYEGSKLVTAESVEK